jgi:hypothetical protein
LRQEKMKPFKRILVFILIVLSLSCSLPGLSPDEKQEILPETNPVLSPPINPTSQSAAAAPSLPISESLLSPNDLVYLGAFRLPDASGGSSWDYSGQGLAYNPTGDPQGVEDGFPGSLFGVGHDQQMQVSEINIPVPIISKQLDDLNSAETLQPFADISAGAINENLILPVVGLEVLNGRLFFCFGQHMQDFEASHGYSSLDLSNPQTVGPLKLENNSNYTSNDYLFKIPEAWSAAHTPGKTLATGRFREGVWSGLGPALYAADPQFKGTIPVTPLLLYGQQLPGEAVISTDPSMQMKNYLLADHWSGGAWLNSQVGSAVIFVGTKAVGRSWYGFPNGVEWPYDCADTVPATCPEVPEYPNDTRGYWAEYFQAQIIFYSPDDLAAVADGNMMTYQPQPYAILDLTPILFDPKTDLVRYKRDILGDVAYDAEHQLVYVLERLVDGDKSVIHVWQVNGG